MMKRTSESINKVKPSPFRDKVSANALKDSERDKVSGAYWQDPIKYNSDSFLNSELKLLSDQLFKSLELDKKGYKPEQKQKDFEILLTNLLNETNRPVRISLNENDWKETRYNTSSYSNIKKFISVLNKLNYIEMKKGICFEEKSFLTRIAATDKLLQYFPEYRNGVLYKPREIIILHDSEGKLKDYKEDTAETYRIRKILTHLNAVNGKAEIIYQNYKLSGYLVAIFSERWTWYGRLHTRGSRHYQSLSDKERAEITINGDSIVEWDYSALHPYLLYAKEGIQLRRDPYSVIESNPVARPLLKAILLRMINSNSTEQAKKSTWKWLKEQKQSMKDELFNIDIPDTGSLIDKFMEIHKPIAHYLCTGNKTGLVLMNKDSKIAVDVVNYFAKQDIPILCFHDSFVVQKQYRDKLYKVMASTYHKHTGFNIKIKEKLFTL